MLPGFRFLFAAIVLSVSVLIFGLGAAALLRTAHEQFASIPSRRAPPEPVFPRQHEPPIPTLALLRVEPEVTEKVPVVTEKVPDNVTGTAGLETVAPAVQTPEQAPAAAPEKLAALKTEQPAPTETMKTEAMKPETPAAETTPAQASPPETPIAKEEVKLAAIAETPPPVNPAASPPAEPAPEPVVAAPSLEANLAATRIATLGGPAVTIEKTVTVKTTSAKPKKNRSIDRNRVQRTKERTRERRRIAAARRAQLARQAQAAAQQQADPFAPTPARGRQ
jgi:hypothetical protein